MMTSGSYSPLSLPRNTQSPGEPRNKRMRRMSSTEEEMDLGVARESKPTVGTEVTYYGQSPASLSSQTSWHSDVEHGLPPQHVVSGVSLASSNYYQTDPHQHAHQHSPVKYPENGHDTLSDFVTFVCQEAENTQQGPQVQNRIK
ncbi:uncharacterized protein LOC103507772 [Diaphorina citri]|uniref:Uncharacterized protein LOC103507772 n=1 Tax=Diaphorina citri TaxID=121845 RepID=A0A3Q0IV00_DIACI|nr:uncharacterized protein LOC103507772 [Diaphorina citri]